MSQVIRATVTSIGSDGWTLSEMFGNFRLICGAISAEMKRRYEEVLQSGLDATAQNGTLVTMKSPLPAEVVEAAVPAPGLDLSTHAYDSVSKLNSEELKIAQ